MSTAIRSNSPCAGEGDGHHSAGRHMARPQQRHPAGTGATSARPPHSAASPAHSGGCGSCTTAHAHWSSHCSSSSSGASASAAPVHKGGHKAPSRASGVTTKVTQGMAARLASSPDSDSWPNSIRPSGASASEMRHCSPHKASARAGSEGRSAPCMRASVASSTPTATKLSQKPACHRAQGSSTTTTASARHHTAGQGQRSPAPRNAATLASMQTVRCAGSPQPLNSA